MSPTPSTQSQPGPPASRQSFSSELFDAVKQRTFFLVIGVLLRGARLCSGNVATRMC